VIFACFSFKPFVLDGFLASCNRKVSIGRAEHAEHSENTAITSVAHLLKISGSSVEKFVFEEKPTICPNFPNSFFLFYRT
jgi:hypothetical protein